MQVDLTGDYYLDNDIDCSETIGWNYGCDGMSHYCGFTPIGADDYTSFIGTLNGNNHKVTNLYIYRNFIRYSSVGLFYGLSGAVIKNLGLVNVDITGARYGGYYSSTGGIAGFTESSTINNTYVTGSIKGYSRVGALVGETDGSISNSYSSATVLGYSEVGGLVGENEGTVTDSYNTGTVTSTNLNVGGLVGSNHGTVTKSYNIGNISASAADVGGITGENVGGISYCFSTGRITGGNAGGIVGVDYGSRSNVYWYDWLGDSATDCYYMGNTGCTKGTPISYFYNVSKAPMASWSFPPWSNINDLTYYPPLGLTCNPSLANTSWSAWQNMTACLTNNSYEQNRNKVQYDENDCLANTTFYDYQWLNCSSLITDGNYCPKIVCVNDSFTIYANYNYNGTPITNATITITVNGTNYTLFYNPTYEDYRSNFTISSPQVSNYTINVPGLTTSCSTESFVCYDLTIKLWQEKAYKIYAQSSQYAVKVRNYDKQLDTPYINDFAYIIAIANEHNVSGLNNQSCNLATGPQQKFLEILNLGNWMGNNATQSMVNLIGNNIGCNKYWFRAKYDNGVAVLRLPWTGNYSLFLLDGVIMWKGDYTPPDIVRSDLYLPLGDEEIATAADWTENFWIPRKDLDFGGPLMDFLFIPLLLVGVFIFFALIFFLGVSFIRALGLMLLWFALWTFLRML
jgi:hypothetical protein